MDYHTDRKVIFSQDSEFESLYSWSLQEFDKDGNKIGRDQIPWHWTLYFSASELSYSDTITLEPNYLEDGEKDKVTVRERQGIRAKLKPGGPWERLRGRETSYFMFGTNRDISTFDLVIEKIENDEEQEKCTVWGCLSYTTEIDFRDETTDDCIVFHLYVRSETFSRWADMITASAVDEAVLRVGGVSGFYSDWSPTISTDEIKVLTEGSEHKVEMPDETVKDIPRLGNVRNSEFYLLRKCDLVKSATLNTDDDWNDEPTQESLNLGVVHEDSIYRSRAFDSRVVILLSSLRIAAWALAGLLFLILIK